MSDHDIKSHIKVYWNVFFALIAFTVITVAVSNYDFGSVFWTFFVGLGIACFKGYLVSGYFMHLNSERKSIYALLGLATVFLFVLLSMPFMWRSSGETHNQKYETYIDQDEYVINKKNSHDEGGH